MHINTKHNVPVVRTLCLSVLINHSEEKQKKQEGEKTTSSSIRSELESNQRWTNSSNFFYVHVDREHWLPHTHTINLYL